MKTTAGSHSRHHCHAIDKGLFRSTVGRYASGIMIITMTGDQSGSPSVMKTSTTHPRIRDTGTFTVNILGWNGFRI